MPDPRAKPLELLQGHRTNAEKQVRAAGEKALTTSKKAKPPRSVKDDKRALAYWRRLLKILGEVSLDEAFFENVLARYCVLLSEVDALVEERAKREANIERMRAQENEFENPADYYALLARVVGLLDAVDKAIAKKRDQLLAIERENLLTVQGKLRAIPKKPEKTAPSGIEAFRKARGG